MNALSLKTSTSDLEEKRFKTLQAQFAMLGQSLHRTESKDGAVTYLATRWGLVRHLPSLEAAQLFYLQIGGRHA